MIKYFLSFKILIIGLSLVFWTGMIQAETKSNSPDYKINPINENLPKAQNLSAELSSAVTPPSTLGSLIGTAVGWNIVYVDIATPALNVSAIESGISWGGISPSGSEFTTCTLTLSSPPPGPCWINLGNGASYSTEMAIDSQTLIVTKATSPTWFPTSPSASFTSAYLTPQGQWFSNTHDTYKANPYPSLEWYPAALTITYQ